MTNKKIYSVLTLLIIIFGIIVFSQAKKSLGIVVQPNDTPLISSQAIYIPMDLSDPTVGSPGAAISIIEFGSIGCAECARVHAILYKFVQNNTAQVQLVWKDVPTTGLFSSGNFLSHQAAYCAGLQGRFWPFLNLAMNSNDGLTESGLRTIADELKLGATGWWQCATAEDTKHKMESAKEVATALGVSTAPAIFINNKQINLRADINLEDLLDRLLQ
ncbi:MAG: DsbA family protein [bacterium]|nr:DsbA family protein [bacterium]